MTITVPVSLILRSLSFLARTAFSMVLFRAQHQASRSSLLLVRNMAIFLLTPSGGILVVGGPDGVEVEDAVELNEPGSSGATAVFRYQTINSLSSSGSSVSSPVASFQKSDPNSQDFSYRHNIFLERCWRRN